MIDYKIVIPSYQRPQIFKDKTLALLKKYKIPIDNIDLLLGTPEEGQEYRKVLGNGFATNFIYHGQKGIGAVRNFIKWYYKYQTNIKYVIYLDDDIEDILDWDKPIENFESFIENMFYETETKGLNLWGVSAFHNPFFLKKTITTNLKYICGAFNGEIIDRTKHDIYTEYDHFEDFAFTCEHYIRDGGVVRNNGVCIKTKYFSPGGICASYGGLENRKKDMEEASKHFKWRYGNMCRVIEKAYGFDLRLNSRYKIE
tara:strand:+ start:295 stop:1062 length:768 start_codon:yes stop_codon:yes gene_type:complete